MPIARRSSAPAPRVRSGSWSSLTGGSLLQAPIKPLYLYKVPLPHEVRQGFLSGTVRSAPAVLPGMVGLSVGSYAPRMRGRIVFS